MNFTTRINDFETLRQWLRHAFIQDEAFKECCIMQSQQNRWFTIEYIETALAGIDSMLASLDEARLLEAYPFLHEPRTPQTIAVISAGNIPLAGFHDFLAVLLSGNCYQGKLSREDALLLPYLAQQLIAINPEWAARIAFVPQLSKYDKVIATGGNNSARYFEYYFKNVPLLLRHHRNSVAVLQNNDSRETLQGLAADIFTYFGLGCRSISKIYVPRGYDFSELLEVLEEAGEPLIFYHAYSNILLYQQAIYAMNRTPFIDGKTIVILENKNLASPIGVLHYEEYDHLNDLNHELTALQPHLQCIVSNIKEITGAISLGLAQSPSFYDFPDGEDIVQFCC